MLTIYPAVDLKDGCVVRLVQGKFGCSKVYSRDAVAMARRWARQGAAMIHVVDLDGALTGKQKNIAIASDIAARVRGPRAIRRRGEDTAGDQRHCCLLGSAG